MNVTLNINHEIPKVFNFIMASVPPTPGPALFCVECFAPYTIISNGEDIKGRARFIYSVNIDHWQFGLTGFTSLN